VVTLPTRLLNAPTPLLATTVDNKVTKPVSAPTPAPGPPRPATSAVRAATSPPLARLEVLPVVPPPEDTVEDTEVELPLVELVTSVVKPVTSLVNAQLPVEPRATEEDSEDPEVNPELVTRVEDTDTFPTNVHPGPEDSTSVLRFATTASSPDTEPMTAPTRGSSVVP